MLSSSKVRRLAGLRLGAPAVCGVCLVTAVIGATAATSGARVVGGIVAGTAAHAAGIPHTANGVLSAGTANDWLSAVTDRSAARTGNAAHVGLDGLNLDSDGPVVTSPAAAPWSAVLGMEDSEGNLYLCSGSIISATEIITAGHCTYDQSEGGEFATGDYAVVVGTANLTASPSPTTLERDTVSAVRTMPGYVYDAASSIDPYDVAELTLSKPLQFNAGVQPIAVVGQGDEPAVGTGVSIYGWGEVANGDEDGYEHTLASTLIQPWVCASGQPSSLCSLSAADDACPGDSGSGLVVTGASPVLIGVTDYTYQQTSTADCAANDPTGYADLASPEFAQWLAGSSPTLGPTTSSYAGITDAQPQVGSTATCTSPTWSGSPNVSFLFIDADEDVLQTGPSSYAVPQSELGQTISCVAVATNAGGTAYAVSGTFTSAIEPRTVPGLKIRVTVAGAVTASTTAGSQGPTLTLKVTLKRGGATRFSRTYSGVASFSAKLSSLQPGDYSVCVVSAAEEVYASASECVDWLHGGVAYSYLHLRARNLRGRPTIVVTTQAPIRGDRATVTWAGSSSSGRVEIRKRVSLPAKETLRAPATAGVRWLDVTVAAQRHEWQGAVIGPGSRRLQL